MKRKLKESGFGLRAGLHCLLLLFCYRVEALSVREPFEQSGQCPLQSQSNTHDGRSITSVASHGTSIQSRELLAIYLQSESVSSRVSLGSPPKRLGQERAKDSGPLGIQKCQESSTVSGEIGWSRISNLIWDEEDDEWIDFPAPPRGRLLRLPRRLLRLPQLQPQLQPQLHITDAPIPTITHEELIAQTHDDERAIKIIVLFTIAVWFVVFGILL